MTAFLISIGALIITLLGGEFALRFKDRLHIILAISAGAVIGVGFFDLLKESLSLGSGYPTETVLMVTVIGILLFPGIERLARPKGQVEGRHDEAVSARGKFAASSLSLHSFLDGMAIALTFKVSIAAGIVVAIAVLVHDFSDGINTASIVLKNGGTKKDVRKWVLIDGLSPVLGAIVGTFITLPENHLALVLALFAGFFMYIGLSDLLPESYHEHSTFWTTIMTFVGAGVMFVAIRFAGI